MDKVVLSGLSNMEGSTRFLKEFYYGSTDDKFVKNNKEFQERVKDKPRTLDSFKYKSPNIFLKRPKFKKLDPPIAFRTSPDSLLSLAAAVAEKLPLPQVYKWNIEDICKWLRQYGYPQYQNTFRVNLINGRSLLLLDASALSDMNIKNFDHIRHIAYGIRLLFYYEMTKFGRSISLPAEYLMELYKLLRVKNGTKYDVTKCTDLWRKMQLIRDRRTKDFREHWDILESWLKFDPEESRFQRFGGVRRYELYKCKSAAGVVETSSNDGILYVPCKCFPPCECFWTERELRDPWTLKALPAEVERSPVKQASVLSVLTMSFPERYREPTVPSSRRSSSHSHQGLFNF